MEVNLTPKTNPGRWSLVLIILMPVLFFIGSSFTNSLYASIPAGNTILEDIAQRPALACTMLSGILAGILAFILGLLAILKSRERSAPVYISTAIGTLLVLFLMGEVLFPH